MNKKTIWLILISIFLISLIALSVHAASKTSFIVKVEEGFGHVTTVLGAIFLMFGADKIVWIKLMMWIAVFAVIYHGGLSLKIDRKLVGIIAAVISLMTVILTPEALLITVASTYVAAIIVFFIAVPFVLLERHTIKTEKLSRWSYIILIFLWIIFLIIISAFNGAYSDITGAEIRGVALIVFEIIFVLSIITMIILGFLAIKGPAGTAAAGRATGGFFGNLLKGGKKGTKKEREEEEKEEVAEVKIGLKEFMSITNLIKELEKLKKYTPRNTAERNAVIDTIDDIAKQIKKLEGIGLMHRNYAIEIYKKAKDLGQKEIMTEAKGIQKVFKKEFIFIVEAMKHLEEAETSMKKDKIKDAQKLMTNAQKELRRARRLISLTIKLARRQFRESKKE